jgi:hypothetical protein
MKILYPLVTTLTINNTVSWHNIYSSRKTTSNEHCEQLNYSINLLPFQVDANAIFVDYSNISMEENYFQSVSDIRVAARYVTM